MSDRTVGNVMTRRVTTVKASTPFKDVARLLARHDFGAVPVVDDERRPIGIVSTADLLLKEELAGTRHQPALFPPLDRWLRRHARQKAAALRAEEVMAAPVVVFRADRNLADAARAFHALRLRHAPVVDDTGRLIGMVTRSDLLKPFAMDDDALRCAILTEVLDARFGLALDGVQAEVADGVVTLSGRLADDQAREVCHAVEAQPGVVAVVDLLSWMDETGQLPQAQPHSAALSGGGGGHEVVTSSA